MSNIRVLPTIESHAASETIVLLEELLEEARAGNVVEVLVVAFRPNGDNKISMSPLVGTLRKLGALAQLQHDLLMARG